MSAVSGGRAPLLFSVLCLFLSHAGHRGAGVGCLVGPDGWGMEKAQVKRKERGEKRRKGSGEEGSDGGTGEEGREGGRSHGW